MKKALIAMSGGVDSSVAAFKMKERGFECVGCTMKLYTNDDAGVHTCCSSDDVEDARSVAYSLGMPFYVFNFKDGFREKVIDKFIASYLNGNTPNPCIDCNRYLKFGSLYERARMLGCEKVVTGHYARIEEAKSGLLLKKGIDDSKDQSYVLYSLTQEQLEHTDFPLGSMSKAEVRAIALENGFINADKPDSQDICFVHDGDYAAVIKRIHGSEPEPGPFLDTSGKVVGEHKGIIHYTVGQHRRLGMSFGSVKYVVDILPEQNAVVVGEESELYKALCYAEDVNWISGKVPESPLKCSVKIRYRKAEEPATVTPVSERSVRIDFDRPQRAITPGQAAVLYDGDTVLGGGTILREGLLF